MKSSLFVAGAISALHVLTACARGDLEKDFLSPPDHTKPRCYWYWMNGNISKEGITHDLEAMKRVGIGEGYIGIIEGGGEVKALTEPWWDLVEHAVREGSRLGVDVGLFNSPGWSQSGGPWVKLEQSMRYVTLPEMRIHGPQHFEGKLPEPDGFFQDIAVLAFPAPANDADTAEAHGAKITRTPTAVTIEMPDKFKARSLVLSPVKQVNVSCELQSSDDGQNFKTVKRFLIDRHNLAVNVGPVPLAPISISFPAVTAKSFRLAFSAGCEFGDIKLSGAARLESYSEKQLAKVFQEPQPPFDFYLWPAQSEPDDSALAVKPESVRDISAAMNADGTLKWDVPEGDWIILRTAMQTTGTQNSPAPPEATGPEVDKMSRAALKTHFDAYVGKLLARIPPAERKAWKHVVADSYEMGPENWTDDFAADFQKKYGYDPKKFLPAMTGRIVGSADQSDRFLWDLRRLIADRVAHDYVGGLRDLCHEHGMKMWLENYGHWGFPAEFLQYGGSCDEISGEYWADGNLGSVELRDASSAAHIYGMPIVWAESFTGGPAFRNTPRELKARGDWAFCEGVNQAVLHVYIHQPWDERRPGANAWFGTEFNRNNTWFEFAKPWIDYQRRCSVMLQAGRHVADIAYFIGEDAPKMTGERKPGLPAGRDFDYINGEVIENRLSVKDGMFVLPDGMSYRILVLPQQATMRPELLKKIHDLVAAGGAVLGAPPERSPSLQNFPVCDGEVKAMAAKLWRAESFGKGRVFRDIDLTEALRRLDSPTDVVCPNGIIFTHRRDSGTDVYFLANQTSASRTETISFRIGGRAPEFWWPETGRIERPAVYQSGNGRVRLPVHFGPKESVFVVFREKADDDRIIEVTRNGEPVFDMSEPQPGVAATTGANTFFFAVWAKPDADTGLPPEANDGVHNMGDGRNDAIVPPHGDTFAPGGTHAGCGLAIGRNGVTIFEHGANYFSPVLVHAAAITNWTHITVVYRDGEPSLYLNGAFVHKGLKSLHTVHSGVTAAEGNPQFVGKLGTFETSSRSLDETEVAALMKKMPRSDGEASDVPIKLLFGATGEVKAHVHRAGTYAWKTATGKTQSVKVDAVPAPVELSGPWQVSFDPKWGGPPQAVTFAQLEDWTKRNEEGIRFYSGTATYRKTFELPDANDPLWLDLGDVNFIARVRVNGNEAGTVWKKPYAVEITKAAKRGANTLEIEVVNPWLNRLVGDDQPGVTQRWTFATTKTWDAHSALLPSGLIGPVRVMPRDQ